MSNICQLCMSGSSFEAELAQYVLMNGVWHPWPLVASKPDGAPCIRLPCHKCLPNEHATACDKFNERLTDQKDPSP
jgi:hypothetical protein